MTEQCSEIRSHLKSNESFMRRTKRSGRKKNKCNESAALRLLVVPSRMQSSINDRLLFYQQRKRDEKKRHKNQVFHSVFNLKAKKKKLKLNKNMKRSIFNHFFGIKYT